MAKAEEVDRGSLYNRINAVKADVKRVKKTGTNQHFGYKFATESDISDCLRELMHQHGVCLVYHGPTPDKITVEEAGTTKSGQSKFCARVWIRYELVNVDDPAQREEVWGYGEALDMEDKGHNKAITNCHKYVLMKVFDVSTGDTNDDPDLHAHEDGKIVRRTTQSAHPGQTRAPAGHPPPAGVPGAEGKSMGIEGKNTLLARMDERGITLKEIRAGLYKRNLKDVLKGREMFPQLWPEGIIDDIKTVLDTHPVLVPTSDQREVLRRTAVRAWNKQAASYDPGKPVPSDPSYCTSPDEVVKRMEAGDWSGIKDEDTRIKQMIESLNGSVMDVQTGSMIPF